MSTVQPPADPATEPRMRADARRNLERIMVAAREVFVEEGIDGSVEEIARRAGVGVGTLYRRFPTKEDLVDAIIAEHLDALLVLVQDCRDADDPWEGFCALLRQTLELFSRNRGFKSVIGARIAQGRGRPPQVDELREATASLVARAQAAGELRADFATTDLPLIFRSVGSVMEATRDASPRQWERFVSMLLDGLRASAATPTPVPAMTDAEQQAMGPGHGHGRGPSRC